MQTIVQLNEQLRQTFTPEAALAGKTLVLGEGQACQPCVMLIGEAPGEQEDRQGRPFVGKAGRNLDEFLHVLALNREDIYITNTVKIRPTKTSEKGRLSNRTPNEDELKRFVPYLLAEIALVQPKYVVTLGNTALHAILGRKTNIGECHGQRLTCRAGDAEIQLFPLYHPASVIYNQKLKDVYQADLAALKRVLEA